MGSLFIFRDKKVIFIRKLLYILGAALIVLISLGLFTLYGPFPHYREIIITSSMRTASHQYIARLLYDKDTISEVMNVNRVLPIGENTDVSLVKIANIDGDKELIEEKEANLEEDLENLEKIHFNEEQTATLSEEKEDLATEEQPVNEPTKEPLTENSPIERTKEETFIKEPMEERQIKTIERQDHELYKIIYIKGATYKAYLCAVFDPSLIKLGVTKHIGEKGEFISKASHENNALVAINASGFKDKTDEKMGGIPDGLIINNGEIVWDNKDPEEKRNIIGFNNDNILVLFKGTPSEAIENNYRIAVEFQPFLIVNGNKAAIKGNGGWGIAPRTAIGQTEDGTVLFLVVDGRRIDSLGASILDLQNIMWEYGAINAANLDGGATTIMVEKGKVISKPASNFKDGELMCPNWFMIVED